MAKRFEVGGLEVWEVGHGFSIVSPCNPCLLDTDIAELEETPFRSDEWFRILSDMQEGDTVVYFEGLRVFVDSYDNRVLINATCYPNSVAPFCELGALNLDKIQAEKE